METLRAAQKEQRFTLAKGRIIQFDGVELEIEFKPGRGKRVELVIRSADGRQVTRSRIDKRHN